MFFFISIQQSHRITSFFFYYWFRSLWRLCFTQIVWNIGGYCCFENNNYIVLSQLMLLFFSNKTHYSHEAISSFLLFKYLEFFFHKYNYSSWKYFSSNICCMQSNKSASNSKIIQSSIEMILAQRIHWNPFNKIRICFLLHIRYPFVHNVLCFFHCEKNNLCVALRAY